MGEPSQSSRCRPHWPTAWNRSLLSQIDAQVVVTDRYLVTFCQRNFYPLSQGLAIEPREIRARVDQKEPPVAPLEAGLHARDPQFGIGQDDFVGRVPAQRAATCIETKVDRLGGGLASKSNN